MTSPKEEGKRVCTYCAAGRMKPGTTTITLERSGVTLVVKKVPGMVCPACGEAHMTEETVARLEDMFERARAEGMETVVRRFEAEPVAA